MGDPKSSAANHLLSKNPEVAGAAAEFIWRGYSDDSFQYLFTILADAEFPGGRAAGYDAAVLLAKHCRSDHRDTLDRLSWEYLGRALPPLNGCG